MWLSHSSRDLERVLKPFGFLFPETSGGFSETVRDAQRRLLAPGSVSLAAPILGFGAFKHFYTDVDIERSIYIFKFKVFK